MVQGSFHQNGRMIRPVRAEKWILSCGMGEFLGMLVAGSTMFLLSRYQPETRSVDTQMITLVILLMAGAAEGALIGFFQWRVLRKMAPGIQANSWIGITILAALVAWGLGSAPGWVLNPSEAASEGVLFDPPLWLMVLGGAGSGIVLGALFGIFQNMVLKNFIANQWAWTLHNALGWALAMAWIFLAAGLTGADWPLWRVAIMAATGGGLAGLSLGWVTAFFFRKRQLLRP